MTHPDMTAAQLLVHHACNGGLLLLAIAFS